MCGLSIDKLGKQWYNVKLGSFVPERAAESPMVKMTKRGAFLKKEKALKRAFSVSGWCTGW